MGFGLYIEFSPVCYFVVKPLIYLSLDLFFPWTDCWRFSKMSKKMSTFSSDFFYAKADKMLIIIGLSVKIVFWGPSDNKTMVYGGQKCKPHY